MTQVPNSTSQSIPLGTKLTQVTILTGGNRTPGNIFVPGLCLAMRYGVSERTIGRWCDDGVLPTPIGTARGPLFDLMISDLLVSAYTGWAPAYPRN